MSTFDATGSQIKLGKVVGQGGEAVVYRVLGQPNRLAKIYTAQVRTGYYNKLAWMLEHPPNDPTLAYGQASLAWPQDLLFDEHGELSGYLMTFIQGCVPLLEVFNPRRRAQTLPKFDRRYLHRAARNLTAALGALHASDYIVGDLNESNILVRPTALITLIDTDSFQVQEKKWGRRITHSCPVARFEYTPPELQGMPLKKIVRGPEHDAFSLGVLIYQLLMDGNHPFRAWWLGSGDPPPIEERIRLGYFPHKDGFNSLVAPPRNAPGLEVLHPKLVELVLQCFVVGHRHPNRRPKPGAWLHALGEAEKSLVLCRNGHYYSDHLKDCPQCNPVLKDVRKPPKIDPGVIAGQQPRINPVANALSQVLNATSWVPPWWKVQQGWRIKAGGLFKRVIMTGMSGALSGALAGAVAGLVAWLFGKALGWGFILALGGSIAGFSLSWKLGLGFGKSIHEQVGWPRFWQIVGTVSGSLGAGYLIWLMGRNTLLALAGVPLGGIGGWLAGKQLGGFGRQVSWGLISMGVAALVGMWAGWTLGYFVGETWLGVVSGELTSQLAVRMVSKSMTWQMVWVWVGTAGGCLGGGLAGIGYGITISVLRINL
jgi:serine/threonine protein kinase